MDNINLWAVIAAAVSAFALIAACAFCILVVTQPPLQYAIVQGLLVGACCLKLWHQLSVR